MRVAWIVYSPWGQKTGGYVYDAFMVAGLRAAGHAVEIVELPGRPSLRETVGLPLRLAALAPDVVIGDELCHRELAAAFALRTRAVRVMLVHHPAAWELPTPSGWSSLLERRTVRAADATLATSEETASRLLAEGWCSEVAVVEPGADRLPARQHRAPDASRIHLLCLGAVIPRKRVPELLDAFEACSPANARLTVAGSLVRASSHAAGVTARVAGSPVLSARVRLLGEIDDATTAELLADADALVFASALEGYGIVTLEALRAGVPPLASRTGAAARLIREGVDGLVFDAAKLEGTLRRFFDDAPLRASLLRGASERAATLPTWHAAGRSFTARVETAWSRGRSRPC